MMTFARTDMEVRHERQVQAIRWWYVYSLHGNIDGGVDYTAVPPNAPTPRQFYLTVEQGTDFYCEYISGSDFTYDARNASAFPAPNSAGLTGWASRGLRLRIADMHTMTELTSDFVPFELICPPATGSRFFQPFSLKHLFNKGSKIRFEILNHDSALRNTGEGDESSHYFKIALHGYKIMTPG